MEDAERVGVRHLRVLARRPRPAGGAAEQEARVYGVLNVPWMRTTGVNLAASRGLAEPTVWLVAHLDSKSQPVPSVARMAGVVMLAVALVVASMAAALTLVGVPTRTLWWGALAAGVL